MENATLIPYTPQLNVVNLESLPRSLGAPYLQVIEGMQGAWVAMRWRRVVPAGSICIKF